MSKEGDAVVNIWHIKIRINARYPKGSDVWLTVHLNSLWKSKQLDVTFVLSFISPLQVAQHVSGKLLPIFRS